MMMLRAVQQTSDTLACEPSSGLSRTPCCNTCRTPAAQHVYWQQQQEQQLVMQASHKARMVHRLALFLCNMLQAKKHE
jgi:hypothetical protein